jgi:hypothetical protein
LATSSASSALDTRYKSATGPNTSSVATRIPGVISVITVGW